MDGGNRRFFTLRHEPTELRERGLLSELERHRPSGVLAGWLAGSLLLLLTLTTIGPLVWMVSGALKTTPELLRMPPALFPAQPQWDNYLLAWQRLHFTRYFSNTLLLAFGSWALQLSVATLAAFALSKLKPAFGNVLLGLFVSTLMVPPTAYLIPQYLTVVRLPLLHINLIDTWWAVWLPQAPNAFNIFVLKRFFDTIPVDLTDAAQIDGANYWQLLVRIVLPLAHAPLTVISILIVLHAWQDFFWPFLVLPTAESQPIMVALYRLNSRADEPLNIIVAALVIASVPPILLFTLLQPQIMRGMTFSGLKS